uniref:Glycolate oxidase iron-sulfur subunit n=1 Tax=Candidatus Kentrum sp. TUN TaxID=2126343 RepID=A0A450ZGS1_9GAMM|nr:MAG: glycolate oxidase iron-sulfur subunit [Candidatus Kentron sp. TUN]VFK52969.1 MAG: glycolate oxidase iron-sulfur subunit [Candidatus Kentron sp. TUN]VFK53515.1 MAG: glycolate oxidase iron-sulfur subunit [Candidatus Kentron sp. TUN]
MKTSIAPAYQNTPEGLDADTILRTCVHCGLCTATCPTYQLLGDERDSPRGRIYLIKQVLEGKSVSRITRFHLDRCLICNACETTCPSGVRYHHLLHIGRGIMDKKAPRPLHQRLQRLALRKILPYPKRLSPIVRLGRMIRPVLPNALGRQIPQYQNLPPLPHRRHQRKVLMLEGCAQSVMTPKTNAALTRILDRIDTAVVRASKTGCCGAVSYHLAADSEGMVFMRRNIDAWWPYVEAGIEGIIISASGCGAMVKDYGYIFRHDPEYAEKAARISWLVRDPVTLLADADPEKLGVACKGRRIAFHAPCSLQHGLRLSGRIESLLKKLGFTLTSVSDAHLCCGSAGTYSLLQPALSQRLLVNKLSHLEEGKPEVIATANVGCQLSLQTRASVPVQHWIELLDV